MGNIKPVLKFRTAHKCQHGHLRFLYSVVSDGGFAMKFEWGERKCDCPVGNMGEGYKAVSDADLFSGFFDKNGKEIYDEDYLKLINEIGNEVLVKCTREIFTRKVNGRNVEISGFCFLTSTGGFHSLPIVNNYAGAHDCEIMELCGNLYEGFWSDQGEKDERSVAENPK